MSGGHWNRASRKSGGSPPFMIPMSRERDKGILYIEYEDKEPDPYGKRFFTMRWWDERFHTGPQWRAQVFRADPKPYIERARAAGLNVEER